MNNSATTRVISKIALEYNGKDKGMAIAVASNFLLSTKPEDQYVEMKTVADRNQKVKKWALTGYISPPEEIGKSLSDSELTDIAIEALKKVGVTENNQYRLDIHNSTKQKHIHFIVHRISIDGKCTVKAHDVGKRFGEAVRQVCQERNLKTDVEIGIEKRAGMLKNLTESVQLTISFDELVSEMKNRGYVVQLSKNEKIGISGMRVILESDINRETERQYKPGYKLSEISGSLKVAEIKNIFEIKSAVREEIKKTTNLKQLKANLFQMGFYINLHYKEDFKPNQKNEIEDIIIRMVGLSRKVDQKNGLFIKKHKSFSLSDIDNNFSDFLKQTNETLSSTLSELRAKGSITEIAEELIDDILKPHYVAQQEDDWWKKKRKGRR